jgi:hypothetical protein
MVVGTIVGLRIVGTAVGLNLVGDKEGIFVGAFNLAGPLGNFAVGVLVEGVGTLVGFLVGLSCVGDFEEPVDGFGEDGFFDEGTI